MQINWNFLNPTDYPSSLWLTSLNALTCVVISIETHWKEIWQLGVDCTTSTTFKLSFKTSFFFCQINTINKLKRKEKGGGTKNIRIIYHIYHILQTDIGIVRFWGDTPVYQTLSRIFTWCSSLVILVYFINRFSMSILFHSRWGLDWLMNGNMGSPGLGTALRTMCTII